MNTPEPTANGQRVTPRGKKAIVRSAAAALVIAAYLVACWAMPAPGFPTPSTYPSDPAAAASTLPAAAEAGNALANDETIASAVSEQLLPSAAGWLESDTMWANDDNAYPIASLTKLVTALVGLEAEPLELGEQGAVHVWDEFDVERQFELLALDGVAFPIPAGTEVTRHQMLTLMLIPSANDFAMSYAYSVFGDNASFVEAVDAWKNRHGISSLQIEEPSGMSAENVANAADLVRISRLALAHPVVAEIIASAAVDLPWGIGEVMNSNPLFGVIPDVVGVKTGYTDAAGFNLAAAVQSDVDGRTVTAITVVLGRDSTWATAEDSVLLLTALMNAPHTAEEPPQPDEVPIHIENESEHPSFWWRITHPLALFGMGGGSPVT